MNSNKVVIVMKIKQALLLASAYLFFAGQSVLAETIISQTTSGGDSGAGNYGQSFQVDSSLPDTLLSSFSLTKGASGGGAATTYIDVYTIGTAVFNDLNFGTGTETANLTFLGSSTNSLDTTVATGTSLTWNFDNIALPTDEAIFLVFSDDFGASISGFVGTSVKVEGVVGNQVFTNTDATESHTLAWGGNVSTAFGEDTDNQYSVTLVSTDPPPGVDIAGVDFENGSGGYSDVPDDLDATDGITVSGWTGGGFSNDSGANGDTAYEGNFVGRFDNSSGSYFTLTIPDTVTLDLDQITFAVRAASAGGGGNPVSGRDIQFQTSLDAAAIYDSGDLLGRDDTVNWAGATGATITLSNAEHKGLTDTTVDLIWTTPGGGGVDIDAIVVSGTISVPEIPPTITNTTPSYKTDTTAGLAGILDAQQTNVTVYAYWSTNDYDGQVAWESGTAVSNMVVGSYTNVTNITVVADVENLIPETDYYYTLVASNAVTNIWATPRGTFTTDPPPPPPGVDIAGGATNIGVGTASLRAELTNGVSVHVYICWGAEAGDGVSTSTWENVEYMGLISEGTIVTNDISGLLYGIEYSYRVYATNSEGSDWSNESSFYTDEPTSAWTPADISTLAWFDAADAATLWTDSVGGTHATGTDAVAAWEDKSSNERHLTQGTPGNRPKTGGSINGVNALTSDDTDFLSFGSTFGSGVYDIFYVGHGNNGGNPNDISLGGAANNTYLGIAKSGDGGSNILRINGANDPSGALQLFNGETSQTVSSRGSLYTEIGTSAFMARFKNLPAITDVIKIMESASTSWEFVGDTGEVLFVQPSTEDEAVKIEGYLAWKWGLQGNLPGGHTYASSVPTGSGSPLAIANTEAVPASTSAELSGTLDATQSVFTVYAAYSESNNTSAAEWEADDTKTLVPDATYTNVMGQAISVTVGSLTPETTYYFTLVASNAVTNIWATPSVPFTTLAAAVAPGVSTNDGAFDVSFTTASLRGEQTAGGNADVYICWGTVESGGDTSSTSTWANVDFMGTLSDGDIVTNNLTGLNHSTAYHYVVYATNSADVAWSDIATFSTDTPGDDRYATGTFTWSTGVNAWSFESGGPYNQPWEAGKNAILEGDGTTVNTVTLGENVSLAHLLIDTDNYRITGNTLNFAVDGTITNLGNSVHIISGITGEPDVYVKQANGWNLSNPAGGGSFGSDGFMLLPNSAAMAIGTIHRGEDNYFWLGGSAATNTVADNPYAGTPFDKTYVDGTGTWAVNKLYGGQPFQIKGGTLIANGALAARNSIELEGGVLHVNHPNALGSNSKPLFIEGGDLDNSSGAPVTSAYNFIMRWYSDWTFFGSQGANSDLNLGTGAVTMYADRSVTVADAAATLTVGGAINDGGSGYSLTKDGAGTLVLGGNNTYAGETIVEAGTLSLSQSSLSDIAAVRIAAGATLNLTHGVTNDVLAVYTNGVEGAGGTWGAVNSGADNETALITGSGMLKVEQAVAVEGIRYWDGGSSDIGTDGNQISNGGAGTWNTSIVNWDAGAGVAHTNWNNATDDLAVLAGTAGTVTLAEDINLGGLSIAIGGYTIEANTLLFSAGGSITNTTDVTTGVTISSAITGAPDVWPQQGGSAGGAHLTFAPTAGSVTLGTIHRTHDNNFTMGGTTTGNTVIAIPKGSINAKVNKQGSGTWKVAGDLWGGLPFSIEAGTLIVNGNVGSASGPNISSGATLAGTATIDRPVTIPAGAMLAPGDPTGTMTITNNNCTIAGTLQIAINDSLAPVSGWLDVDGALDISAASLSVDLTGTATAAAYIIAEYNSLVGTFAAFSGLPMGYTVDCSYEGDNVIALVGPQPSLFRFR